MLASTTQPYPINHGPVLPPWLTWFARGTRGDQHRFDGQGIRDHGVTRTFSSVMQWRAWSVCARSPIYGRK